MEHHDELYPLRDVLEVIGRQVGDNASSPFSAAVSGFLLGLCVAERSRPYSHGLYTLIPDDVKDAGYSAACSYLAFWPLDVG